MKARFWIVLALAPLLALLVIALFALSVIIGMSRRPYYSIITANRTHNELDNVWVYYGTTIAAAPGRLIPGQQKSYAPVGLPVPEEVMVTWTDQNGVQHSPKARLAGIVPRAPRWQEIWLIVEEDGTVTVKMLRHDDIEGSADLRRSLHPYRQNVSK